MDAAPSEPFELAKVGQTAIDRRLVELEVARVDDQTRRRVDREADRIRDAVADAKRLDSERTGSIGRVGIRIKLDQIYFRLDFPVLELGLNQPAGELGRVD